MEELSLGACLGDAQMGNPGYSNDGLSTFVGTAHVILALDACGETRLTGEMR